MVDLDELIQNAPDNFVIQNALIKCAEVIDSHEKIMCSVSGGADSDVMLDMIIRCGGKEKTTFVFFDTGVEYQATIRHLDFLTQKYGIGIKRERAQKSIPMSVRDYGVPFLSKEVSSYLYYLQMHGFEYEDNAFEYLMQKYPHCKGPLKWWCNYGELGKDSNRFMIKRYPFLKDFIIANPPEFKISPKCCTYAKKNVSHKFERDGGFDVKCLGVRKSEGGIRATTYTSCFSAGSKLDQFRPIFWFRNCDKEEYCRFYGVTHSECYSCYKLQRTGCVGCPFNKNVLEDLKAIQQYEPQLYRFAHAVFGQSYEYTRKYYEFREEMKRKLKSNTV